MLCKLVVIALSFTSLVAALNADASRRRRHHRSSGSSSSSSSSYCPRDCTMFNPGAPCTNCGCDPDNRQTCPFLQIPLRPLPMNCTIPDYFFRGKRVLVTGATSGIGLATGKQFLAYGASVVGTSRNPKNAPPTPFPLMKLDYSKNEEVDELVHNYVKKFGCPPDILIDNGAIAVLGISMDIGNEWYEYEMKTLYTGHVRLIQGFIRKLPSKLSHFISLSTTSVAAYVVTPDSSIYSSGKYALRQFIENWGLQNSDIYPNVFLGYVGPMVVNTNFAYAAHYGSFSNPQNIQIKNFWVNLIANGMDPYYIGRAFLEFAYTRVQGQTCDIGYIGSNFVTQEARDADYALASALYNIVANNYPINYIDQIASLLVPYGLNYSYNTSYTQCIL